MKLSRVVLDGRYLASLKAPRWAPRKRRELLRVGVGTSGKRPAGSHNCFTEVVGFNAEIQPAPTISSLGTTSGSTAGGTSVTISGTDLENATSVSFGSTPAASYIVNSESQITAVAPASASAASVSVTVTTIAGKAIASQQFGYVAPPPPPVVVPPAPKKTKPKPVKQCVVPKLKGKKLRRPRRR